MMACWKQNEFRDEACRKEIQDFFDCASRAEVTEGFSGALFGGKLGAGGRIQVIVLLASCQLIGSPSHSKKARKIVGAISLTPEWKRLWV